MRRFLIADDHEVIRRGLKQILLEEYPFAFFEEAGSGTELITKAIANPNWDIIISDLAMPGGGGMEALQTFKKILPQVPVLILSIYPEDQYAVRVIKEGAAGYLNKDAAPEQLVNAVQKIISGRRYISDKIADKLSDNLNHPHTSSPHLLLSEREYDVFKMIVEGRQVSEIAAALALGPTTISTYRSRILSKMNLKNNAELIQYAIENGLL